MLQQGQVFRLSTTGGEGEPLWAYRYRTGGRGSKRVQRGGFACEQDAPGAGTRARAAAAREGWGAVLTLAELVESTSRSTTWSRSRSRSCAGCSRRRSPRSARCRLTDLRAEEIAAWRMTIAAGYRFEATQALRQVLARAVVWGMLDVNPAKLGVDNPPRRRTEQRPFESWAELDAVAAGSAPRYGPMVIFAAATGLRPANGSRSSSVTSTWSARRLCPPLVHARVGSSARRPRRAAAPCRCRRSRSKRSSGCQPSRTRARSCSPPSGAATSTCTTSATASGSPPSVAAGIEPSARIYDLRHTFATFALRAGISTFDLSRYMGASLTMIDRHYGHLARDGREHAIRLLDELSAGRRRVDAGGRSRGR